VSTALASSLNAPPVARAGGEVLYEVECTLDPSIEAEFDAWLPGHIEAVLKSEGFSGAEIAAIPALSSGPVVRRTSYRVRSQADLERYLENDAPRLRGDALARFGDKARFERRVFASRGSFQSLPAAHCLNCSAPLIGTFCAACGQNSRRSARSVGTLLHDAWHVFTHLDSTLWRTLRLLLFRPGLLTKEYFAEKRASYIPPFRLYLVISLLFFFVTALTSEGPVRVSTGQERTAGTGGAEAAQEPGGGPVVISVGTDGTTTPAEAGVAIASVATDVATDISQQIAAEFAAVAEAQKREASQTTGATPDAPPQPADAPTAAAPATVTAAKDAPSPAADEAIAPVEVGCEGIQSGLGDEVTRALRESCLRAVKDGGAAIKREFFSNMPKTMFIFLPVMAAFLLLLYWRPRRYYVEHLVFFLHTHSAMFLLLLLLAGLSAIGERWVAVKQFVTFLELAFIAYLFWYLLRAMHAYYGQSWKLTIAKFSLTGFVYSIFFAITLVATVVVSALTA